MLIPSVRPAESFYVCVASQMNGGRLRGGFSKAEKKYSYVESFSLKSI